MGKLKKCRPRPARPNPLGVQRNEPNGANGVAVGDVTTPTGKVGGAVKSLVDKVVNFLKIQGLGWGGFLTNCTSLFKSDTYIYIALAAFLYGFFFFFRSSQKMSKSSKIEVQIWIWLIMSVLAVVSSPVAIHGGGLANDWRRLLVQET